MKIEEHIIQSPMAKGGEPPLKMACKRYTDTSCNPTGVTLLFTHCVGSHKEQWEPTIQDLFNLQGMKPYPHRIREAWAVDWPSHGESALINEAVMTNRSQYISAFEWVPAVVTLLKSSFLSGHRIVGVGHSAGANTITLPLQAFPEDAPPFVALILIEPTSISLERYLNETDIHEPKTVQRTQGTISRRDTWANKEEADSWLRGRFPWRLWDHRVLTAFVNHGMHNVPSGVTLNLPKVMEGFTYPDVEPLWVATAVLRQYRAILPIHFIFGTRNDFVSTSHQSDLLQMTAGGVPRGVIRIQDAGHMVVQEKPLDVANGIYEVLSGGFELKSHM